MTALLLDLDGTLLDTPRAIAETLQEVFAEFGRYPGHGDIRATIGRPLNDSVAVLLGTDPGDPLVGQVVDRYRACFARTVLPRAPELLLPGVLDGLRRAREAGLGLGVVTSKISASALPVLDASGLAPLMRVVACHDMVTRGKPHPDLALYAARELGVPPAGCAVIGDSGDDMRMASNAEMTGFGVTTGVGDEAGLLAAGAHAVANDFSAAVQAAIGRLTETPMSRTDR